MLRSGFPPSGKIREKYFLSRVRESQGILIWHGWTKFCHIFLDIFLKAICLYVQSFSSLRSDFHAILPTCQIRAMRSENEGTCTIFYHMTSPPMSWNCVWREKKVAISAFFYFFLRYAEISSTYLSFSFSKKVIFTENNRLIWQFSFFYLFSSDIS